MLINYEINTNLEIKCLKDLHKLKDLQNNGLKVNKSELARRLGKDRRTITKYINGYEPKVSRRRSSQFDDYYVIIDQRVIWRII